ncbi:hypothetical protein AAVH_27827 [Aphelenchoides avenae]|nr:hypothetical protein AAVH_27827 [Aphelenchus avenae]
MWLWAVLSLSCCLIITVAGIIALRVGFPAWFTTVAIITLLATSAMTHAKALNEGHTINAIGRALNETPIRASTQTQMFLSFLIT